MIVTKNKTAVRNVIKRAKKLIQKGWIKCDWYQNDKGESVSRTDKNACKFCAEGAIQRAIWEQKVPHNIQQTIRKVFKEELNKFGYDGIMEYNDTIVTKKEDVINLFDKVSKLKNVKERT